MNKNGFTLVELLITIVVIGLIMVMIFPSAARLSQENSTRLYEEYEKMMIEYAKISKYNNLNHICLRDLDELEDVKNKCDYHGYVIINHSSTPPTYQAFISCPDYVTTNYSASYLSSCATQAS